MLMSSCPGSTRHLLELGARSLSDTSDSGYGDSGGGGSGAIYAQ